MTKDLVLETLWANADENLSGEELASRLSLSRAAVWKAVEQLRAEGYLIESAPRRGYRLLSKSDVLSVAGIQRHLKSPGLRLRYEPEIGSTNTALKELANAGEPAGLALVAGRQSAGRGRMGRSFFSPGDTGVYLSLLLRPTVMVEALEFVGEGDKRALRQVDLDVVVMPKPAARMTARRCSNETPGI